LRYLNARNRLYGGGNGNQTEAQQQREEEAKARAEKAFEEYENIKKIKKAEIVKLIYKKSAEEIEAAKDWGEDVNVKNTKTSVKSHIESDYKNFDYDKNKSNIESIIKKLLHNDHFVKTKDINTEIENINIKDEDQRENMYEIISEKDTEIYNLIDELKFNELKFKE